MGTLSENSNRPIEKSTNNLVELMHEVLDRAKAQGATDVMVSVNHDSGFSVDVRMGEVETVAFSEDKGISLVVYIGHRKGGASSTDTSPAALDALVTAACDIAKVSSTDPCFGLADRELMTTKYPNLDLYHPWAITPPEAIEKALACETQALALDKRISNSDGVNLSTYAFCHAFATTNGGEGVVQSTRHSVSCSLIAKQGESMQRDYDYTTARYVDGLYPLDKIARNAVERAVSRLGARQIKTQKIPVLFSSRVSSSIFSSFINAISGGNLYRKNSFLLDSIDQQIFPAGFRVYEQPYLLKGLGSSPFDGEGVPTRNNVFIEDGVLRHYVLGSYSARRLGLKTTANSGGVHNLTIDATAGDLQDLLKKMNKGLLVTELMGQGINGLTGDYSRGASGFWVENGQIQYPVEEITIAGNLKDMFKAIVAVGTDINPNLSTRCGSVLIEEMMVAGH
ncbi:peptide maturation protein PmbA [Legionella lansingensis]|uniref:Peptide maturation protein PmbA n=1 Tax=Legionella lansingensis TaxID=45067 RepID=A0A0W0VXE3_9GAMM|nr:metalloprotease PmbA [Legionella lansingensis]KTD24744.1 peptide maturation protein PmbA [Legionella lansingensis]SNV48766.1 peptide maturation protein PmbA [Legionella lansingensis]